MEFVHGLIRRFPTTLLARLKPGEKRTWECWDQIRKWNKEHDLKTRLEEAWWWLNRGNNLGFIMEDSPFWVVDLDVHLESPDGCLGLWPDSVLAAINTLRPPTVRTPSGGLHAYFRLPADLIGNPNLKAHICHPNVDGVKLQIDLKLGGRATLVVAPGSLSKNTMYLPENAWVDPTELDPRALFPSLSFLHNTQPYVKNERPLKDRIIRARQYLTKKAPVSVSDDGGKRTLISVATHLVGYLDLPNDAALKVMTTPAATSWNSRCLDKTTGRPYPWINGELLVALTKAKGLVPAFGVYEWKRQQKDLERDRVLKWFFEQILMDVDASPVFESCQLRLAFDFQGLPFLRTRPELEPLPFDVAFQVASELVEKVTGMNLTQKRFGMYLHSQGIREQRKGKHRGLCILVPDGVLGFYRRCCDIPPSISSMNF